MDKIQKALIKAGRKDLAQKYYKKVAATVPAPFVDGDEVEIIENIYQLNDSKIYDLISDLEQEEKKSKSLLFSDAINAMGDAYAVRNDADKYQKSIASFLSKYIDNTYYFLRYKAGTKAIIRNGHNRGDIILEVPGKTSAMPIEVVKYLKKS